MKKKEAIFFASKIDKDRLDKNKLETDQEGKVERKNLLERLRVIIQTISGKKNLEVSSEVDPHIQMQMAMQGKDARKAWYRLSQHDPATKKQIKELVHIPEDIPDNEDIARGLASHEAGHVAISRFGEFVPDKVIQEIGFHSTIDAVEERPTDQVIKERYSGAGKWIDRVRQDSLKEGSFSSQEERKLGYIPKFIQLLDMIVYGPYLEEEMLKEHDRDVIKTYKKIEEHVNKTEKILPTEDASEKDIVDKAKERYRVVYSKIWPEVKKLVTQDLQSEDLRQMINESLQSQKSEEKEKKERDPLADLSKKFKKKLEEMTKGTKERKKEEEEKRKKETGEGEEKEREAGPSRDEKEKPEDFGEPVPIDQLSDKLKEKLKKIFRHLPKEKQDAIKEKSRKIMEEIEDSIVEDISGKLLDLPAETHKEYTKRKEKKEKELKRVVEREKIEKELKDIEVHLAQVTDNPDFYDKTYDEIRELDDELYRRLEEIFVPTIKRETRLVSAGAKINLPAVFRWEAEKAVKAQDIDSRIFESVHLPEKKDYVFTLLVDLSGSMRGEKIEETFKGAVLLNEVLNRLGVNYEILGFQDELIEFKDFDQELNDEVRKKMAGMVDEVYRRNKDGHNQPSYNDDGPCLEEASKRLETQPNKEKFLVVLSDGIPEGRRSSPEDLTEAVKTILQTTDQKLIGIGLSGGTEHVKKYYPTSLPNINVQKFPEVLRNLLEDIIRNPAKYKYSEE